MISISAVYRELLRKLCQKRQRDPDIRISPLCNHSVPAKKYGIRFHLPHGLKQTAVLFPKFFIVEISQEDDGLSLSVDLLRGDPVLFRYKAVPLIPGTCQAAGPKAMTLAARNTAVPKSDYSSSNTRIPRSTTPANACA